MRVCCPFMKTLRFICAICTFIICFSGAAPIPENGEFRRTDNVTSQMSAFLDEAARMCVETMGKNGIPGLSIVLVDGNGAIWEDGFGWADGEGGCPVTPDTRFSIQSMSKTFTAVAVLAAVRDGLLDLDAPISRYLPGFRVQSIFEERPADRITLRHLLTHTAGFAHEAPLGNNYTPDEPGFDDHVASIQDTWLRFKVGEREEYSNLGMDLAAYILEKARGLPIQRIMWETVLQPLGMDRSTETMDVVDGDPARAIGHGKGVEKMRSVVPMTGAGGVWTTAHDLGIFLRFMLGAGKDGGILSPALFREQSTTANGGSYGLGIAFDRLPSRDLYLVHGGGGFGFLACMAWYPTHEVGIAVLTNSADHANAQRALADRIVSSMMAKGLVSRKRSLLGVPVCRIDVRGARDLSWYVQAHPDAAAWKEEWSRYLGDYVPVYDTQHLADGRTLIIARKGDRIVANDGMMFEAMSGLFFSLDGTTADFRGPTPLFMNIPVRKK